MNTQQSRRTTKRRANVTLSGALLDESRSLDLNVSAIAERALDAAVRQARARVRAWREESAEALSQRTAWIETNGMPLAAWQSWKP